MSAVPFDTLKFARRLESAGFPPKQAGDTAEALAEAMSGAGLATSDDIASVRTEISTLRAELKAEIVAVRSDLVAVRAELKAEIAAVRAEIELLRRDLTIRLGSMLIVAVGILLAAIRYLPPPHP
jgi:Coiled-coil domain-containing protein 90-like